MNYGTAFSRIPTKEELSRQNSLISVLISKSGYEREPFFKNIELEAKIDVGFRFPLWPFNMQLNIKLGEESVFGEPYSLDEILEESKSAHHCYSFIDKETKKREPAFTKVVRENGETKIKVKGTASYRTLEAITLIQRDEKHFENLTPLDVNRYIAEIATINNSRIEYVGHFLKRSKEAFVLNPTSGRIFVIATNICEAKGLSPLYQLEVEYYGKINNFPESISIEKDLANLTNNIIDNPSIGYSLKNSRMTKFEWLTHCLK